MIPVAIVLVEHDRFRVVRTLDARLALSPDAPAETAAAPLDLLGEQLQQGGCGAQCLPGRGAPGPAARVAGRGVGAAGRAVPWTPLGRAPGAAQWPAG